MQLHVWIERVESDCSDHLPCYIDNISGSTSGSCCLLLSLCACPSLVVLLLQTLSFVSFSFEFPFDCVSGSKAAPTDQGNNEVLKTL